MSSDVQFDYEGACEIARTLWRLADEMESFRSALGDHAGDAAADWKGPLVKVFREKIAVDRSDLQLNAGQLREGAKEWAKAYAEAVDQQNTANYSRQFAKIARQREERNLAQDAIAVIYDDLPLPKPRPKCPVPQAPAFAPTDKPRGY
jgi:hypothetical protein